MADFDKLVESFFSKKEKVLGHRELYDLIKESLLQEKNFDFKKLSEPKYFNAWVDKINKGEPFLVDDNGTKQEITINPEFAKTLQATKANDAKMKKLFQPAKTYVPVIPDTSGKLYALNQISKEIFTGTKAAGGALQGTDTPDMKEGLACYFYLIGMQSLQIAESKIKSGSNQKINLPIAVAQNINLMGAKASGLVVQAINHLNNNPIDKDDQPLFLNAISAAKTILKIKPNSVIDRGSLFTKIRAAASDITGIEPDKWCPGDVYVYSSDSLQIIEEYIKNSVEAKAIILPEVGGDKGNLGLNSLFDLERGVIKAISLKEEKALHGRATGFVSMKTASGEELSQGTFELNEEEKAILSSGKAEKKIKNVKGLTEKFEQQYIDDKKEFENLLRSAEFGIKEVKFVSAKERKVIPTKRLLYLVSKSACYRFMQHYLKNFENLKGFNEIMESYKNPLLALTAYGVGLSGFNPTFYKVQASSKGEETAPSIFKGRDSLKMSSESVLVIDTMGKAGFLFQFVTKMGEKNYTTTLDIRFAGGLSVSVIVQEFKQK